MADIGKRIREKREAIGMTQEELASKLGYKNKSSIAKIETGTNDIVQSKVVEFAAVLNTTVAYLMGWDINAEPIINEAKERKKSVRIPVVGIVPAGSPIEACEDVLGWEEIPEDMARTGEYFALEIKGNSMETRISNGDIVIVRIQSDADSGSIVIARIGDDEEVTCKKLLKNKDGITLMPFNPTYDPLYYSNKEIESLPVKIVGKVVEQRRKY